MKITKKLLSIIIITAIMAFSVAAVGASATTTVLDTDDAVAFNGHSYKIFYVDGVSPLQAESYCERMNGHLVTITSSAEQDFVYNYALNVYPNFDYIIIGGTDADSEGEWKWMNGEKWSYENWRSGEPNNGGGAGQNYSQIVAKWNGAWDDFYGAWDNYTSMDNYFICEWDTDTVPAMSLWQRILNFFLMIINFILGLFK